MTAKGSESMPKAVRYDGFGGIDVLNVVEVPRPSPAAHEVLVEVKAAGINPGEAPVREGAVNDRWPSTFPSGQGSDLAGVVREVGADVSAFEVGDEVIGWVDNRSSQAEFAVVEVTNLVRRPSEVSWEEAGALFVAGTTAYACVRAVAPSAGETVVVSGSAGGVGSITVQLARLTGATVIGLASEVNHEWLADHGVIPVAYGDGVSERIRAAAGAPIDAFIDCFGAGYVELALALGVAPPRINTIANFEAVQTFGVKADGTATAATADVLAELAGLVDTDQLEIPIAAAYPLAQVRAAYTELEQRHTRGKIVLVP
jgi:NADPH:quinone reductase-like Zn-dependent oxidoreductase